ncbi:energy-coupling factor ABC transporter ATP-binding protein [Salisediminibacterium selenitireducens]|uniref:ABC transporter related protein n=1 Tax=Bacillus selenitireducens (strain ATCC 700615 / DSM 15326 / MLS10) TaxID=439292 RepID=D6XZC4_BACIE|nr:ATP-binding cassette domain-containing protein [Salisediminibacterium selenitireducens]ADI00409.1 ABC transporter related protein [[Bacillus] selenitireducens MLS10]
MSDAILAYEGISCRRGGKEIVSLDGIALQRGDRLGMIGPNGAGKSTLLKGMAMLEPPDAGIAYFEGEKLDLVNPPLAIRRRWASVFQHSQRFQMNVFRNVELGLKLRKVSKQERAARVMHWLEVFQIAHLANEDAGGLSGGEAQRMNLARAFVLEPDVLFLDEPFSALDYPTKMGLIDALDRVLQETGTTAVLISHDLTDIAYLTNRLIYIENGKVCSQGHTAELLTHPHGELDAFLKPWKDRPPFRLVK